MADTGTDTTAETPRAPSVSAWAAMSEAERRRAVAALPSWLTEAEASPPEGDDHYLAKEAARDALTGWFKGRGRGFYVGCETVVYYPDARRFAPDLMVVLDVEPGRREKWVVSAEGKGLDFVLEVLVSGDRHKDLRDNVELYASLGIPEYFVFDVRRLRLHGWRLGPQGGAYQPVLPQHGRYASEVLGLELLVEGGGLRFALGNAPVLDTRELLARVSEAMEEQVTQLEARLAESEAARAESEARLAEALAEIARLRGEDRD